MNIVYASDDRYADLAGVSLLSLYENNQNIEVLNTFILDDGISETNKEKICSLAEKYGRRVLFMQTVNVEETVGIPVKPGAFTLTAIARLFLGTILPQKIEKVLYIDCDTMIRGSLAPLWEEELEDHLLAGVVDLVEKKQKKFIFLKNTDIYINSGVLLIDLKAWRAQNVERRLFHFAKLFNGKFQFPDQDIINGALHQDIKLLKPKYNSTFFYFNSNREEFVKIAEAGARYDERAFREAKENPVIVHFVSSDQRPWIEGNTHRFQGEYFSYRDLSPFDGHPVLTNRSFYTVVRSFVRKLPTPMYKACQTLKLNFLTYKRGAVARRALKKSGMTLEEYLNS